jgi:hypothetical protein
MNPKFHTYFIENTSELFFFGRAKIAALECGGEKKNEIYDSSHE